jgi:hypothetical protein
MMPFDQYPDEGNELLGKCGGANCRHEYGLKLQQLTGQVSCAYCGLSLVDTYEHWLLMSVDHVIPTGTGLVFGIEPTWLEDFCNTVLCCSGCNGFRCRFEVPSTLMIPTDVRGFVTLRDTIFAIRKELILAKLATERAFYQSQPWEKRPVPGRSR